MNYNEEMKKIIKTFDNKKTILLHSCCGPCSSSVIERIKSYFDITILYYNPNIEPKEEYEKRKSEQIRLLKELNIKYMDCDYDNDIYHEKIKGTEEEKEGGSRCTLCFMLRLSKTAKLAKENNFDYFGTTLTVSPHKNSELINKIGFKEAEKEGINFLPADFKKEEGYKRSIELSKKYNLYRQDYCGCIYSKEERMKQKGFTLVELISVIAVLGIIMVIVIPAVTKQLSNSKDSLRKINIKNAEESALLLITDLNTCDSEALNILKTENILTETQGESYCLSTRNALKGGIEVSIDVLKKYNYLTDYDEQCSGTVTLKINNANPEADGSNIECRW